MFQEGVQQPILPVGEVDPKVSMSSQDDKIYSSAGVERLLPMHASNMKAMVDLAVEE